MALMRHLLIDAQAKFRRMVEDNKQLAMRLDGDLQSAHQEVSQLRQDLADTNRRITQLNSPSSTGETTTGTTEESTTTPTTTGPTTSGTSPSSTSSLPPHGVANGTLTNGDKDGSVKKTVLESKPDSPLSQLRHENDKLLKQNRILQREVEELRLQTREMRLQGASAVEDDVGALRTKVQSLETELKHAKEALAALKADRKRLKAEKFDLLNQMKQLYGTLEDKEKELRDFIRNYEQRMKDSDESLRQLAIERDETEREKWSILKHARDEAERSLSLSAQLSLREAQLKQMQEELHEAKRQLMQLGYYSDQDTLSLSSKLNGPSTPSTLTPMNSHLGPHGPHDHGSSADSGVRLGSDRESSRNSGGGNISDSTTDGAPTITIDGTVVDADTLSMVSSITATHIYASTNTPKDSPSLSPLNFSILSRSTDHSVLSRSAEHLCNASETLDYRKKGHRRLGSKGTWGSISRVFARSRHRKSMEHSGYDGDGEKRSSWSPQSSLCASPLTEESYTEKLRLLEEASLIPMERWKAPAVLAWLEITLGMPQYGLMCAENVKSGKVLLELSDSDLETGLGISHPMHRKKLRLAIEEHRNPSLIRFPRIGELGHVWVASEWLPDIGLPQYAESFTASLVDARLLDHLSKKELEKFLGVTRKFHQASIVHGIHLLRMMKYDRQALAERRRQSEHTDADPLVWTNHRFIKWAKSIDLGEYADNLKDSGVHGGLVVLESSFNGDTMATALGIPPSKNIIRRHLTTELEALIHPARNALDHLMHASRLERKRAEKLAGGGSLGRNFSRSYGSGLQEHQQRDVKEHDKADKRRSSLRAGSLLFTKKFATWRSSQGSLSRALGLKVKQELHRREATSSNCPSAVRSPGYERIDNVPPPLPPPNNTSHRPHSAAPIHSPADTTSEKHRRVKSIGDIETITVTPV